MCSSLYNLSLSVSLCMYLHTHTLRKREKDSSYSILFSSLFIQFFSLLSSHLLEKTVCDTTKYSLSIFAACIKRVCFVVCCAAHCITHSVHTQYSLFECRVCFPYLSRLQHFERVATTTTIHFTRTRFTLMHTHTHTCVLTVNWAYHMMTLNRLFMRKCTTLPTE